MAVEVHTRPYVQDSGHMGTESRQVARHMMDLVKLGSVVLQCREEGPLSLQENRPAAGRDYRHRKHLKAWRLERHLHSRMSSRHITCI